MTASLAKDRELLDAVRAGDESALRELLERHGPTVFRFAMKMCRHRDDAEDVAQETLLAAVRGAKDVRGTTSFTTWLYAVARSFCIKMRRRQKIHPGREVSADDAATETPSGPEGPDCHRDARNSSTPVHQAVGAVNAVTDERHRHAHDVLPPVDLDPGIGTLPDRDPLRYVREQDTMSSSCV